MLRYIIQRLFLFIPTLVAVSLFAFIISINAPGDPVERLLSAASDGSDQTATGPVKNITVEELRNRLGLNLPVFYFSLQTRADIDTLYRIPDPEHRSVIKRVARETGNPEGTLEWFALLAEAQQIAEGYMLHLPPEDLSAYALNLNRSRFLLGALMRLPEPEAAAAREDSLNAILNAAPELGPVKLAWKKAYDKKKQLFRQTHGWKKLLPSIKWYGINNQYHHWIFGNGKDRKGVLRGDFGLSYRDGQPIGERIVEKVRWSLTLTLISLLLAYLVSIPVGLLAGYRPNGWFDKTSGIIGFGLYALPSFFVGTFLLVLFANPDILDWFPVSGVKDPSLFDPEWSLLKRLQHYMPYLVLPVVTYTYASFAFISRLVRAGIGSQLRQDYIRTARAKGLSEWKVVARHAFRNTLLPLITIVSVILPLAFGGSIIVESLFSIPGMGLEVYESVLNHDYPMIVAVFTLFGFLTLLGYLLADIGYALADPRIRYSNSTTS